MSNNEIQQSRPNSPARGTEVFRTPLPTHSRESRIIAKADRQAVVRAREIANDAAITDFMNELKHQIKLAEIQRRLRRTTDCMHGSTALMSFSEVLAKGDPTKSMELNDFYNAWKAGEIYRIATEQ